MMELTKVAANIPNQSLNKPLTVLTKKKEKDSSSKKIEPPDDNLDVYFSLSQAKNSQGTANVAPTETPKKLERAKLKDDSKDSSHRNVNESPQGSGGEASPEPTLKSKGSPQQVKPESEDSSSDSQSSDEEKVSPKEKMKELPPPPPKKKCRS